MSHWLQGDIHYAHFDDTTKNRPVVLISDSDLNGVREKVIVALITRTIRETPFEIPVGATEGLSKEGVVSLSDIETVPKRRLSSRIGTLSSEKMDQLREGLKLLFALT
jgi:mRNA-degrading endonuclease toxin of MazEF toxin-antitoxin module